MSSLCHLIPALMLLSIHDTSMDCCRTLQKHTVEEVYKFKLVLLFSVFKLNYVRT